MMTAIAVAILVVALGLLGAGLVWPVAGLMSFAVFTFLRPTDLIPALAPVPFVKVALGVTLLSFLVRCSKRKPVFFRVPHAKAMVFVALALFLSVPFSVWRSVSLKTALDFVKLTVVFFLMLNLLRGPRPLERFLWVILLCNCVLATSAAHRYLTGDYGLHGKRIKGLVGGHFGDPNDLALSFIAFVPVAYAMFQTQRRRLPKLAFAGMAGLLLLGVLATQSRGGYIGAGFVVLLTILRSHKRAWATVTLAIVSCFAIMLVPEKTFDRIRELRNYRQDESAMGRIIAWKAGLQMFRDNPLFGIGAGAFESAYGRYYRPHRAPAKWIAPHSSYIQVLSETGLLGTVCFCWLIWVAFARAKRAERLARRHEVLPETVVLSVALRTGLTGFLVSAAFLTQAYSWVMCIVIGSLAVCERLIRAEVAELVPPEEEPKPAPEWRRRPKPRRPARDVLGGRPEAA